MDSRFLFKLIAMTRSTNDMELGPSSQAPGHSTVQGWVTGPVEPAGGSNTWLATVAGRDCGNVCENGIRSIPLPYRRKISDAAQRPRPRRRDGSHPTGDSLQKV